jgi:hypothetical protein
VIGYNNFIGTAGVQGLSEGMKFLSNLQYLVIEIGHSNINTSNESNGELEFKDFLDNMTLLKEMALSIGPCNNIGPNGGRILAEKISNMRSLQKLSVTIS